MTTLTSQVQVRHSCRFCRGALHQVLTLGPQKLNAFPATIEDIEAIPSIPVTLTVCGDCGLAQLDRTTPPDWLYRTYWYRSRVNELMVKELGDIVADAVRTRGDLSPTDIVVDIGANDGTLLAEYARRFPSQTPQRVAVEPADNLQAELGEVADHTIASYFPTDALDRYEGQCAIVTAVAMCYDLDDPLEAFIALRKLLRPDGVAIIQFQDMGQMLETAAFDNLCHEHLEYYTLHSLEQILHAAGLTIQRVKVTPINGGSLRLILHRADAVIEEEPNVERQRALERAQGLDTLTLSRGDRRAYRRFAERVQRVQQQLRQVLWAAEQSGATIDVYGASTKGNILLQVLGVGPTMIRQAIDRSPTKVGRVTLTGIPIVSEMQGRDHPAQLWLIPIWQFRASVLRREAWYLKGGGRMIFPLPAVEIVAADWLMPVGE